MRMVRCLLAVAVLAAGTAVAEYKEPKTGTHFDDSLQVGDTAVECTGVDYRSKWMFKVYGIGHYGDPATKPAETASDEQKRQHWLKANAAKAFVLKFVRTVDSASIREAWSDAMKAADYAGPNGEALLKAFSEQVEEGDTITFLASADGTLTAQKNGETLGEWKDPALVQALWATWLGKGAVVEDADNLVAYSIE